MSRGFPLLDGFQRIPQDSTVFQRERKKSCCTRTWSSKSLKLNHRSVWFQPVVSEPLEPAESDRTGGHSRLSPSVASMATDR